MNLDFLNEYIADSVIQKNDVDNFRLGVEGRKQSKIADAAFYIGVDKLTHLLREPHAFNMWRYDDDVLKRQHWLDEELQLFYENMKDAMLSRYRDTTSKTYFKDAEAEQTYMAAMLPIMAQIMRAELRAHCGIEKSRASRFAKLLIKQLTEDEKKVAA